MMEKSTPATLFVPVKERNQSSHNAEMGLHIRLYLSRVLLPEVLIQRGKELFMRRQYVVMLSVVLGFAGLVHAQTGPIEAPRRRAVSNQLGLCGEGSRVRRET